MREFYIILLALAGLKFALFKFIASQILRVHRLSIKFVLKFDISKIGKFNVVYARMRPKI